MHPTLDGNETTTATKTRPNVNLRPNQELEREEQLKASQNTTCQKSRHAQPHAASVHTNARIKFRVAYIYARKPTTNETREMSHG